MVVAEIDPKLIARNSPVRGAIPILPMPVATFCFVLNLLVPGLGNYNTFWAFWSKTLVKFWSRIFKI